LRHRLQDENRADENTGENDDGQRANADDIHLVEQIERVVRGRKNICNRAPAEQRITLYGKNLLLHDSQKSRRETGLRFPWCVRQVRFGCGHE
jgi:hypothetical protein